MNKKILFLVLGIIIFVVNLMPYNSVYASPTDYIVINGEKYDIDQFSERVIKYTESKVVIDRIEKEDCKVEFEHVQETV